MNIISVENTHNKIDNTMTTIHNISNNDAEDMLKHKQKLNDALKESIINNKWFYISLLLCFYMFKQYSSSDTSYGILVFSFIFIFIMGHVFHRIAHHVHFLTIYNEHKKNTMNYYIDYILTKICEFLDFHRVIHHDTSINKKPVNICYEFINNFLTQGGLLVIIVWLYNRFIDNRIILLWALAYATIHNINYLFIKPSVHRDHHIDEHTNYGIDIADILFDTKYNLDDIETHNHVSINLIIITLIIIYFYK